MTKIARWFVDLCWECILLLLVLFTYTVIAYAQPLALDADLRKVWENSLMTVLTLSTLGGVVGLLSRLRDEHWRSKASSTGLMLAVVGELSFSIFTGLLIYFVGAHSGWQSYTVIVGILLGSWMGTKAARYFWIWINERKSSLGRIIMGEKDERS